MPVKDENGHYRMQEVATRPTDRTVVLAEDFKSRMRRTLHDLECQDGSRFRIPGYSNNQLKRVWEDAA